MQRLRHRPARYRAHSNRKGGVVYITSGTTAAPNIIAVQLRAGWKLDGVQGRYLQYDAAGDQHVGRSVTGLPPTDADFAILLPFFPERNELVDQVVVECFPNAPPGLAGNLRMAFWHYCVGDQQRNYPPVRFLEGADMGGATNTLRRNKRGDLAAFQNLLAPVKVHLKTNNQWIASPTLEQANTMFALGKGALGISALTPQGRKRRIDQYAWTSAVREKSQQRRLKAARAAAANSRSSGAEEE